VAGRATQRIHTTVELETGQTFVIGGLIQKVTTGNANKVPFLGQLPFIGAAFSTKTHTDDETELVVMVTPHLVDAQSADQVVKVLPGQESRSPDDFELFLEGILEAPRGPRAVFVNGRYVPAHRNGPTADLFPCAGSINCKSPHSLLSGHGGIGASCGPNGCGPALMHGQPAYDTAGHAPVARTPQQLPMPNPVAPAGLKSEPESSSDEPPLTQTGGVGPANEQPEGKRRMELPPVPGNLPTRLPEEQSGPEASESKQVPPVRTMGGETP
jgi:pilus assembly protein CpaC